MRLRANLSTLLIGAGALYVAYKAYDNSAKVVEAVNPTDRNNLANRGFNALWQGATGSDDSLGKDVADWQTSRQDLAWWQLTAPEQVSRGVQTVSGWFGDG